MRITREILLKTARDIVDQRVRTSHDLVSVYLTGSLLEEEPLLGGTTDIDLVFIHDREPTQPREIARLSAEISLDIAHHSQSLYQHPRHLRLHPWIGPAVYDTPLIMHDTQHWFEFTKASAGAQFNLPSNVLGRARQLEEKSRQGWQTLQAEPDDPVKNILIYLDAVETAANAIACLSGSPLTERRFLLRFPERAQSIGRPGLAAGLLGLLGGDQATPERLLKWLPAWQSAYRALQQADNCPLRLHACRMPYYERGIGIILSGQQPLAALWPFLNTWSRIAACLATDSPHLDAWKDALQSIQINPLNLAEKITALDTYLDLIEEVLDDWAAENGA